MDGLPSLYLDAIHNLHFAEYVPSFVMCVVYNDILCNYSIEKQPLDLGIYKVCHETMSFVLESDIPLLSKN